MGSSWSGFKFSLSLARCLSHSLSLILSLSLSLPAATSLRHLTAKLATLVTRLGSSFRFALRFVDFFYFVILMPANNLIKRFVFFLFWFLGLFLYMLVGCFLLVLAHFVCAHIALRLSGIAFALMFCFCGCRFRCLRVVCVIFTLSNMLTFR